MKGNDSTDLDSNSSFAVFKHLKSYLFNAIWDRDG